MLDCEKLKLLQMYNSPQADLLIGVVGMWHVYVTLQWFQCVISVESVVHQLQLEYSHRRLVHAPLFGTCIIYYIGAITFLVQQS